MTKKTLRNALITCLAALVIILTHSKLLDSIAEEYTEAGIERALITFALSRSLNGVISVAQGTEVALSPAGVGLTFAPGQILDPINDLVERFSWVVMVSGSSLGIQRLFLEITSSVFVNVLLTVLMLLYLANTWGIFKKLDVQSIPWSVINKSLVLMIFVRFSVPVVALINEAVYISYLQPQFIEAQAELEMASVKIDNVNKTSHESVDTAEDGIINRVGEWLDESKQSLDIDKKMDSLKQAASDMSRQVINLIVVFVVQTIVFPLLFLWLLIKSARWIMRSISI